MFKAEDNCIRPVKVFKYERTPAPTMQKCLIGKGIFQKFGTDYEEFENGPGNYSTAIVIMDDGTVKNIAVELIEFI